MTKDDPEAEAAVNAVLAELGTSLKHYMPIHKDMAVSAMRVVLDRIARPSSEERWQPIETAPRDGTYVLVAARHEQATAFFRDGRWSMGAGVYFARPTHWQPTPSRPTTHHPRGNTRRRDVTQLDPKALEAAQIKHMVDRFLSWKLPENFSPDGGVSFEPLGNKGTTYEFKREPSGTNLLDATQAEAMVRHMIDGLAASKARGAK